ncbi:MAG TPA: molybdopterin molybdotransferase MoeA [Candidatus Corynebacterium avicola]|uniref:Molybdopterin molybdenumtransferase n=1 Tax=Candidatus Corynebacterium avicola TaxID=2838527 RepID=A0A9D1RMG9_9CORY|nr:molybdopterin molybdotransferase MoeA [Candidatus Corynebacterium avicola]
MHIHKHTGEHARSPEEHLAAVRALVEDLVGERAVVQVPAADSVGRRLAHSVAAVEDSPRFDNSQMDGYALSGEHLAGGRFPVGPTVAAGADPRDVLYDAVSNPTSRIREAVIPVMTGARLPAGTAAVVPVEACDPPDFDAAEAATAAGGGVSVPAWEAGRFVRPAGSDLRAGAELLPSGHLVNPRTVGAVAAQGIAGLPLRRAARVLICTGGDEIGGDGASGVGAAGAAMIRDANGPMLQSLCARHGIEVAGTVRTSDDPEGFRAVLSEAIGQAGPDAVVTSGGISHGRFEVVRQVLQGAAAGEAWFGHVAQQPGGPQGLAEFEGVPVICLPGNPVSTAVSFRLFVAPVLGEAADAADPVVGRAGETLEGLADKDRFLRGRTEIVNGVLTGFVVGGPGSHLLAQSVSADCLLRVPAGEGLAAGDPVEIVEL